MMIINIIKINIMILIIISGLSVVCGACVVCVVCLVVWRVSGGVVCAFCFCSWLVGVVFFVIFLVTVSQNLIKTLTSLSTQRRNSRVGGA